MYNLGEWLAGPIDCLVTDADHLALPGVVVEDSVHTLARHGNVMASYVLNQHQAANETVITVVCEGGTCRVDYSRQLCSWISTPDAGWQHEEVRVTNRDTVYLHQASVFLDAIAGSSPPLCSLDEGIQTLKVNLASLRSADTRTWQEVKAAG
jgi:predicted dehydrogenase